MLHCMGEVKSTFDEPPIVSADVPIFTFKRIAHIAAHLGPSAQTFIRRHEREEW